MSESSTESQAPEPGGLIGRIEEWAREKIAPDIAEVKGDVSKVLAHLEALGPQLASLANVTVTLAKSVDPAAGPAVAEAVTEAEKVAANLEALAGKLLSSD